jgi:hypothetical protein
MFDLVFSLEAKKQGKKILLGKHDANWIKLQNIPLENTIYGMEVKDCSIQNSLADEILSY